MRRFILTKIAGCGLAMGMLGQLPLAGADDVAPPPPAAFAGEVAQHFAEWDRDHDGALTMAEVDRAIANPEVKASTAATAVALRQAMVRDKLDRLTRPAAEAPENEKTYAWAMKRLEAAPRELYAGDAPHAEKLRQGKLGDCFCLAALRGVLQREPAALITMITPQADGSFRVRIGSTDVATPAVTDGEIILGASVEDGLWPVVYEKAVGLSQMKPAKPGKPEATPMSVVTHGGSAGAMMGKLTAHEITRWSCEAWRAAAAQPDRQTELLNNLRGQLKAAFAENRLVTAGTDGRPTEGVVPGITYRHGYTVLGYDAATDEVRLWNPHGDSFRPKAAPGLENGYPRKRGEWSAPLAEVVVFMAGFAFEKVPVEGAAAK